jgi:hypothetical protein
LRPSRLTAARLGSAWQSCGGSGRRSRGGTRHAHRMVLAAVFGPGGGCACGGRTVSPPSSVHAGRPHRHASQRCGVPDRKRPHRWSAAPCMRNAWNNSVPSVGKDRSSAWWPDNAVVTVLDRPVGCRALTPDGCVPTIWHAIPLVA